MMRILHTLPALLALALAAGAHAGHSPDYTPAEVRKVDKEGGKITLRHGEIRNLQMPPMSMVFQVKDAKWLDRFKAGDKVQFRAVQEEGKYVVTELQPDH